MNMVESINNQLKEITDGKTGEFSDVLKYDDIAHLDVQVENSENDVLAVYFGNEEDVALYEMLGNNLSKLKLLFVSNNNEISKPNSFIEYISDPIPDVNNNENEAEDVDWI